MFRNISFITGLHRPMRLHCQFSTKWLRRARTDCQGENSVVVKIWKCFSFFILIRFDSFACNTNNFMSVTDWSISKKKDLFDSIIRCFSIHNCFDRANKGVYNSIFGDRSASVPTLVTKQNLRWIILEISDNLEDNSNPLLSPDRVLLGPS